MSLLEQRGQVTPQPSVASVVLPAASLGSVDQASVEEAVASAAQAARGCTGKVSCSYDEVERRISELQNLVKSCRGPQGPQTEQAAQGPKDTSRSSRSCEQTGHASTKVSQAGPRNRTSRTSSRPRQLQAPSSTPRTELQEASREDAAARAEDLAAKSRNEALQTEVAGLREELREADKHIKVASLQATAVNAELRDRRQRHQQWIRRMQEEATKLRRESQRLDRSFHQAGVEERRIAELARTQPETAEEKLRLLEANCERLQLENERLERELSAGQTELSYVRDVVANAGGPGPHRVPSLQRESCARSAPKLASCNSSLSTPPTPRADIVRTLEHDSSLPQLSRRFHP